MARYYHQCTLGLPMSFIACDECRSKRCSTPFALAWLITRVKTNFEHLPASDDWELDEDQAKALQQRLTSLDVDGSQHGVSPVHLYFFGNYYTIQDSLQETWFGNFLELAREEYRDWHLSQQTPSEAG